MELRQLEYFVAVVEAGGFTRAAERVRVAQPGISAQIRKLEREFGQPLLDRSARMVRLTEAGEAVLPHARAALGAVEDARLAVDELVGLVRGHVAVGTVTSHAVDLPSLLAAFHDAHPGVEMTLVEGSSDVLVERLRAGALDAAIVSLGPNPPADLDTLVVADEAIAAAVGHGHPLAARSSVRLAELGGLPLISLPPGTGIRSHLDAACAAAGFTPAVAFEAGDPVLLAQLAARGLGVAILPDSLARSRPDLHPLAITSPALSGRLAFAWRATGPGSPAGRALLALARRTLEVVGG
ncbi:LysR substrate-binding domain-containing protein [Actinokineospora spheciospongiae]|uniref:LysR substrate-binding domain-containing protein n=1 Tax=Actinokineospora spheciospongiae TaxID=909613 RepID=UPI000D713CE4|nr:LysR substrate-binding domain-containing protein [Actinokineospora spheciospongiae]PWW58370.1 LysR family transcriptional regulator [Actinokineospora spheciospongiae]